MMVKEVISCCAFIDPSIPTLESNLEVLKKCVYYSNQNDAPSKRAQQIGLWSCLIEFCLEFNSTIQLISTNNTKTVFIKLRNGFFITTITLPIKVINIGKKYKSIQDIKDSLMISFAEKMLDRLLLLYSTWSQCVLDYFSSIRINSTAIRGIRLAPFQDHVQKKIISMVSKLSSKIPSQFLICYKDTLAWSGLETKETLILYEYITDPKTGAFDDGFVNQVKQKGESIVYGTTMFSGFLIGPTRQQISLQIPINPKIVTLGGKKVAVVVYQYQSLFTFCFLLPFDVTFITQTIWYQYVENTIHDVIKPLLVQETKPLVSYNYFVYNSNTGHMKVTDCSLFLLHDECERYFVLNDSELCIGKKNGWICCSNEFGRECIVLIDKQVGLGELTDQTMLFKAALLVSG